MTIQKRLRLTLLTVVCLSMCLCTTAFADTDGTEPKVTQQPDQLVLQLGTRWAGVEFELRTDAGVFPAPISCINSTVPIPDPSAEQTPDTQQSSEEVQQPQEQNTATEPASGIPIVPLVVFLVGLACGVGGLVALHFAKRRRQEADYDEWADEDDEQY